MFDGCDQPGDRRVVGCDDERSVQVAGIDAEQHFTARPLGTRAVVGVDAQVEVHRLGVGVGEPEHVVAEVEGVLEERLVVGRIATGPREEDQELTTRIGIGHAQDVVPEAFGESRSGVRRVDDEQPARTHRLGRLFGRFVLGRRHRHRFVFRLGHHALVAGAGGEGEQEHDGHGRRSDEVHASDSGVRV